MERAEGRRRDWVFSYDLVLPPDFIPVAADGEVEALNSGQSQLVAETVARTDDFKFNVNLVLIDLLIRRGLISGSAARSLSSALRTGHPTP